MSLKLSLQRDAPGDASAGVPFDPIAHPEYFEGIIAKRIIGFIIDAIIIAAVGTAGLIVIGILSLLFLGLFFSFFTGLLFFVPFFYHSLTIASPMSATFGQRFVGIKVRRWAGGSPDFIQAAAQTVLFYGSITVTFWAILAVALFNAPRRCVHDFLTGTVVVNDIEELINTSAAPHNPAGTLEAE